jgi:hypothetical protein
MDKLNQRRWIQLGLGLVVMMTISSPQYVWTLFVKPFQTATNASLAAVQVTFTVVIVLQTFFLTRARLPDRLLQPQADDCHRCRAIWPWMDHGLLCGKPVRSLRHIRVLCGLGTGIVYVGIVGLMARWFPGPPRLCGRSRRGRVRHGRDDYHFADLRHDRGCRLPPCVARLRHHPRSDWNYRRSRPDGARRRRDAARRYQAGDEHSEPTHLPWRSADTAVLPIGTHRFSIGTPRF